MVKTADEVIELVQEWIKTNQDRSIVLQQTLDKTLDLLKQQNDEINFLKCRLHYAEMHLDAVVDGWFQDSKPKNIPGVSNE